MTRHTPSPTANAQDVTATHTPGPWNVGTGRLVWVDAADIAQVIRTNGDQATAMANARLIASAPDLLVVAEAVNAAAKGGHDTIALLLELHRIGVLADAAIAKATAA